jgi:NAD-dependent deacetylase
MVLFGEMLPLGMLLEAQSQADRCDVMLVAGSSLEVYPAADLPRRAWRHGADVILVNYQPTEMDSEAAVVIQDDLAVYLPKIAGRVLELRGMPQP